MAKPKTQGPRGHDASAAMLLDGKSDVRKFQIAHRDGKGTA
jgi:hypothetical protein